jgi:GTP-binding protein
LKVLVVKKQEVTDICAIVGVEGFEIGDIADFENPEALKSIADEPTMSMLFTINDLLSLERR